MVVELTKKIIFSLSIVATLGACTGESMYQDVSNTAKGYLPNYLSFNDADGIVVKTGNYQVVDTPTGSVEVGYTRLTPQDNLHRPGVIMFHGGFNFFDERDRSVKYAKHLAKQGYSVMIPSYRLLDKKKKGLFRGPSVYAEQRIKYPHHMEDVSCAIRFFKAHPDLFKHNGKVAVIGHSAGANTAMLSILAEGKDAFSIRPVENGTESACNFPEKPETDLIANDPDGVTTAVDALITVSLITDFLQIAATGESKVEARGFRAVYVEAIDKDMDRNKKLDIKNSAFKKVVKVSPYYWVNEEKQVDGKDSKTLPSYAFSSEEREHIMEGIFIDRILPNLDGTDFVNEVAGDVKDLKLPNLASLDRYKWEPSKLPAMLVIQGQQDELVPFSSNLPTLQELQKFNGLSLTAMVYEHREHGLKDWNKTDDLMHNISNFLDKKLKLDTSIKLDESAIPCKSEGFTQFSDLIASDVNDACRFYTTD